MSEAADVGRSAAHRASDVTGVVGEQVRQVAAETGSQARNLLDEGVTQLREQARDGQRKLVESVRDVAGQLRRMSDGSEDSGLASDLVRQATDRAERVASWLESREPGDVLDEVRRLARRRPGLFLAGATVAGVLAGRLTRNIVTTPEDSGADHRHDGSAVAGPPPQAPPAPDYPPEVPATGPSTLPGTGQVPR
jgi:hypothetical protein